VFEELRMHIGWGRRNTRTGTQNYIIVSRGE
jgi:hypothetical protein